MIAIFTLPRYNKENHARRAVKSNKKINIPIHKKERNFEMDIFNILTLFGGLCLFLYGMNVMGQSLERSAGSKLELILAKLTTNKFAGLLTGLAVTGVIQSSSATTVMVVGCGAVGSFAIEALARTGVGHLVIVDFDRVEESNINRQLFALSSTISMPKVEVAHARIRDINPEIHTDALNIYFDDTSAPGVCPDFIIDAIDTVESKISLYKWAQKHNIPLITSMGAASKTDPAKIKIAPLSKTTVCPLASRVRRMVRDLSLPDFPAVYSTQMPKTVTGHAKNLGSVITITGAFGLMLANYVIGEIIRDNSL